MNIKNYEEVIAFVKKGELKYPIPTLSGNDFFWVKEYNDVLYTITTKGKLRKIRAETFEYKQIAKSKKYLNTEERHVAAILKELNKENISEKIDWEGIIKVVEETSFEDFVEFFKQNKDVKKFEYKYCSNLIITSDSICLKENNNIISFFTKSDFDNVKSDFISLVNGNKNVLLMLLNSACNIYAIYKIAQNLKKGKYLEAGVSVAACIIESCTGIPVPDFVIDAILEYIVSKIDGKYNINEKIEKKFNQIFKYLSFYYIRKNMKNIMIDNFESDVKTSIKSILSMNLKSLSSSQIDKLADELACEVLSIIKDGDFSQNR